MPDFSSLLRKPAGEAKRPPVLPVGDYSGIIKKWEVGDNNRNKTPYVRFHLGFFDFPESVDHADRENIDLSKRQKSRDYYLTEESLFRLDEMLRTLGVEAKGRSYEEVLPEVLGKNVIISVTHYTNDRTGELGDQVEKIIGA